MSDSGRNGDGRLVPENSGNLCRRKEEPEGRRLLRLLREFEATSTDLLTGLRHMSDHGELDYVAPEVARPDLSEAWTAVDEFGDYLQGVLPECAEPEPTCQVLTLGQSLLRRRQLAQRDTPHDLLKLLEEWETEPKPIKKYWGENRTQQNETIEPVLQRVEHFRLQLVAAQLCRWRSHLYSQCVPFLLKVRQACLSAGTTTIRLRQLH